MVTTTRSPRWRPFTRRPFLLTIVGVLVAAIVATVMQVPSQSHAADINGVTVSQRSVEASIKTGTDSTCVITARANVQGDERRVAEFIDAITRTARDQGTKVDTGGFNPAPEFASIDVILSHEYELTQWNIDPANCATDQTVDAHRGRSALELPAWARGMVASAAGLAVYLTITFAVTALFAFLAPELAIWGEVIGGCIGGFASTFVSNYINQVPQDANLTASAVQCVAGAILNVALGSIKQQMVDSIKGWLNGGEAQAILEEGVGHGAGHGAEMAEQFQSARSQLSIELEEIPLN
jgi:hypothetical protein